jgi:hypothetical protein
MSRWEHRTIRVEYGDDCTERLNAEMHKLEILGWELVSAASTTQGTRAWRLFFKRQVLDESYDK